MAWSPTAYLRQRSNGLGVVRRGKSRYGSVAKGENYEQPIGTRPSQDSDRRSYDAILGRNHRRIDHHESGVPFLEPLAGESTKCTQGTKIINRAKSYQN